MALLTPLLEAYLAHLDDPAGGAALAGLLHPQSPVWHMREVVPAGTLTPGDLAAHHAAAHAARREDGMPLLRFSQLRPVRATAEVAWFSARESLGDREVYLAIGLAPGPDGPLLGWATLAEAPADWSYGVGLAQTLADAPFVGKLAPRSWLDCAHRRLFPPERPPLLLLEEARFGCHMSTACCRIDYAIEVAPGFQAVIDAIPWETLRPDLVGTRLPVLADGRLEVKQNGAPCRFLDGQGRCSVHTALGRAVFPPCARFPFAFAATPDGVAVATSVVCGSVRANLGPRLSEREDDLYRRLAIASEAVPAPTSYRLLPDVPVAWAEYRQAETIVLDYLGRAEVPLYRRVWWGCAVLANWHTGHREVPESHALAPMPSAGPDERAAMQVLLGDFLSFLGVAVPPPVRRAPLAEEAAVARLLRHLIFAKVLTTSFDLATVQNLAVLAYLLAASLEAVRGGPMTEADWHALGKLFMHGGVLAALTSAGAADYRAMFGAPEFGLWLLSYLEEAA